MFSISCGSELHLLFVPCLPAGIFIFAGTYSYYPVVLRYKLTDIIVNGENLCYDRIDNFPMLVTQFIYLTISNKDRSNRIHMEEIL